MTIDALWKAAPEPKAEWVFPDQMIDGHATGEVRVGLVKVTGVPGFAYRGIANGVPVAWISDDRRPSRDLARFVWAKWIEYRRNTKYVSSCGLDD